MCCIIALSIFSYYQVKQKEAYKGYISRYLSSELFEVAQGIISNDSLYERILTAKKFSFNGTMTEADFLADKNDAFLEFVGKYRDLANHLKYIDTSADSTPAFPTLGRSAQTISMYFGRRDSSIVDIDSTEQAIIIHFQELNSRWMRVLEKSPLFTFDEEGSIDYRYHGEPPAVRVTDRSWLDLLYNLETATDQYLKEKGLSKLSDVLK